MGGAINGRVGGAINESARVLMRRLESNRDGCDLFR